VKKRNSLPILFLALAFVLGGAKTPLAFCSWAIIGLIYTIFVLITSRFNNRSVLYFIALISGLVLTQVYSLDSSNSLFWTTEYLTLSCLWLALRGVSLDAESHLFWCVLTGLATITVVLTVVQSVRNLVAYGAFPLNPNFNAAWMAALACGFAAKTKKTRFDVVLIVMLSVLVLLGLSRSGLIALIAGMSYVLSQRYTHRKIIAGLIIMTVALALIPHDWLVTRLRLIEEPGRLRIWWLALRAFWDYPLTGYGPGNFEIAYQQHAFPEGTLVLYGHTTAFAHNDYLQAAVELGWPLTILLVSGLMGLILFPKNQDRPLATPARSILIVLGVASFFNPIFKMPIFPYLAILASSCLMMPDNNSSLKQPANIRGFWLAGIPAGILVLVLWCGLRSFWAANGQWVRIVSWNPSDAEAWHNLAYASSDKNEVLLANERAVSQSPHQVYYVEALARAQESLLAENLASGAVENYLRAIQLAPGRAINYLGVARLLWRAGEPLEALKWTTRARALEPYYWESDLWSARCFERMGDKDRARQVLIALIGRYEQFLHVSHPEPESPYEQAILSFDRSVVESELSRLRTR